MFDSLHLLYFLLGTVGAVLTLYLAKQVIVPEFRPLFDITPTEKRAQQSREVIAAKEVDIIKVQAMMTDQPLNSSYLARVFNALQRARNDEQMLLKRFERLLLINQLVSRSLGFFFFVVLGGVFAALFSGQVKVSVQPSQNAAIAPSQAAAIPSGSTAPITPSPTVATALGQNVAVLPDSFQAVIIGAGWTGLVSIFGIRGIQSTATGTINKMGEQSKAWIDDLQNALLARVQPGQPGGAAPAAPPTPDELASTIAAQCDRAKANLSAHLDKSRDSIRRTV